MTKLILSSIPSLNVCLPASATLLGSPLGDADSIPVSDSISDKVLHLKVMGDRLQGLQAHDALLLLKHAFTIPKLLYTLRSVPCFASSELNSYVDTLRSIFSSICNIHLDRDDPSWLQSTLPVKSGGLGLRSAVHLAPSAFLSSAAGCSNLIHQILPARFHDAPYAPQDDTLVIWKQGHPHPPPTGSASHLQKEWDSPKIETTTEALLENSEGIARARLLAVMAKESGACLGAMPISSVGLRLDDNTIHVAVGLRNGASLCSPHLFCHCGAQVDHFATHGLSCRWSEGRHSRHAGVNYIIHRALTSAKIPSELEPSGQSRSGGKCPHGTTIVPWKSE